MVTEESIQYGGTVRPKHIIKVQQVTGVDRLVPVVGVVKDTTGVLKDVFGCRTEWYVGNKAKSEAESAAAKAAYEIREYKKLSARTDDEIEEIITMYGVEKISKLMEKIKK